MKTGVQKWNVGSKLYAAREISEMQPGIAPDTVRRRIRKLEAAGEPLTLEAILQIEPGQESTLKVGMVDLGGEYWPIENLHKHPANVLGLSLDFLTKRLRAMQRGGHIITVRDLMRAKKQHMGSAWTYCIDGQEYTARQLAEHPGNVHDHDLHTIASRIKHARNRGRTLTLEWLFCPMRKSPEVRGRKHKPYMPKHDHKPGSWAGMAAAVREARNDST